jgi:general secretion pathway protein A
MSAPTVNAEPLPEQPVMIAQPGVQPKNTLPPLPAEPLVIRFKSDSNEFSGADIEKMKEFAGIVRMHPAAIINVFGYTDSIGDAGYNRKLSEFRANIVKSFLLGQDIPSDQIRVEGLGDKNPLADNGTVKGRNMNRRVEITVDAAM